jgi:hypothetical protein
MRAAETHLHGRSPLARAGLVAASFALSACGGSTPPTGTGATTAAPADDGGSGDAGAVDAASTTPVGTWSHVYDAACPSGDVPSWTTFTWRATTPDDARIALFARPGPTEGAAATAPRVPLVVAVSQSGNAAFVALGEALGEQRIAPWVRIEGDLYASSTGRAPTMGDASASVDCLPSP